MDFPGLIQFRMRRNFNYKRFDLRKVLEIFSISNGGGHEGAIAFRFRENEIKNIHNYVAELSEKTESEIVNL